MNNDTPTKHTTRDTNLDLYRGATMMYIVGFIHVIGYWINPYKSNLLSLSLFVMPMIFYISGASYALSRPKPYGQYLIGRIKRIIIPLLVYIGIHTLYNTIKGEIAPQEMIQAATRFIYEIFTDQCHENGHLWYITPYFIIAMLLPLMHHLSHRINQYGAYALLLATMVGLYFYPNYVLCYGVSTFAGLYYMRNKPYKSIVTLLLFVAGMALWIAQGRVWNIQINKFPTTLMYLSYTSCMLIIFSQPLKWLCRQVARIGFIKYMLEQYARHGYVIYLFNINVITIMHYTYYVLCEKLAPDNTFILQPMCSLTVISIATLFLMVVVGKIIEPINNLTTRICSLIYHKTLSLFTPSHKC